MLPFTIENFTAVIETGKTKDCSVRTKEGVDLHMILISTQSTQSTRKKSGADEDKK